MAIKAVLCREQFGERDHHSRRWSDDQQVLGVGDEQAQIGRQDRDVDRIDLSRSRILIAAHDGI